MLNPVFLTMPRAYNFITTLPNFGIYCCHLKSNTSLHSKTLLKVTTWKWLWFVNAQAFGVMFVCEGLKIALGSPRAAALLN